MSWVSCWYLYESKAVGLTRKTGRRSQVVSSLFLTLSLLLVQRIRRAGQSGKDLFQCLLLVESIRMVVQAVSYWRITRKQPHKFSLVVYWQAGKMKFAASLQRFPALLLVAAVLVQPIQAALTTEYLSANGLNFTCTVLDHISASEDAETKKIMLLHGFPMFRVWWDPLLNMWNEQLAAAGDSSNLSVHAVACDLRGYSPGASPEGVENYGYPIFAADTFALAEAAGFTDGFDLVGHDHGAGLAWYVAANDPDNLVKTLTTLSVPHIGLMSNALCGDNVDEAQVIASNYFNQFSLVDSATTNNASLTGLFQALGFGDSLQPDNFQKMLWWYNGSLATSFSMPRVVSDDEVAAYEENVGAEAAAFIKGIRQAVPMEERECIPASEGVVGTIAIPTLFICGLGDSALLCNNTFVTDFPPALLPDYEHANYQCGHDFFLEGNCISMEESQKVMNKITDFVLPSLMKSDDSTNGVEGNVETIAAVETETDGPPSESPEDSPDAEETSAPTTSDGTFPGVLSGMIVSTGFLVAASTIN